MKIAAPLTTIAAAVAAAALLASGCSVSTNEEPQAAGELFGQFVQSTTTTTSSTTPPEDATKTVDVYFVQTTDGSQTVRAVPREVDIDASVEDILRSLFDVPPNEEKAAERGLTTQITENAILRSAQLTSPDSNELVIDTGLFNTVDGSELRIALAQIVLTATALPGVQLVSFVNDGEPESPIVAGGETVSRPVTANDYRTLRS